MPRNPVSAAVVPTWLRYGPAGPASTPVRQAAAVVRGRGATSTAGHQAVASDPPRRLDDSVEQHLLLPSRVRYVVRLTEQAEELRVRDVVVLGEDRLRDRDQFAPRYVRDLAGPSLPWADR